MSAIALWSHTQFAIERFPHYLRLKRLSQILNPMVKVHLENQHFEVKTVTSSAELVEVLKLRFDVFFREFSTKRHLFSFFPYDIDMHDFLCDHLVVKSKETGKIVACYRLLSSQALDGFSYYSESEFDIRPLLRRPGHKLELGRACVHADYRNGAVISMLWKGLIHYAKRTDSKYLFGCSSINRKDFENLPTIVNHFETNGYYMSEDIKIQSDFDVKNYPSLNLKFSAEKLESVTGKGINSLLHMYLMAGAKVSKSFAYDEEMDCLDLLTVMDLDKMPASFERRFA